jgi:hypothetical protein
MRVGYFLFLFEALLYDLWQFFRDGVAVGYPFSAFVLAVYLTLFIELVVGALLSVLEVEVEDRRRIVQAVAGRLGISGALASR